MRNDEVYEGIQELRDTGTPGILATVVAVRGSSPGALGAKMVIARDGRTWGTVGGGCVDGQVYAEMADVLKTERPRSFTVDLTENDDPEHGLICGGRVEVFLEPIVTTHLVICGSGHLAHALARFAGPLDFRLTVMDDRPTFLNEERFPSARRLVAEFEQTLGTFEAPQGSFFAIVTRGHRYDQECLEWALAQKEPRYVGLVGSRKKLHAILKRAREKGFSDEQLARVRSPIGLDVGAVTPDEIAVAIAAELVAVRRRGQEVSRELKEPGQLTERELKLARLQPLAQLEKRPSA